MISKGTPVLYVSYDGLLEPLGASQVVPYVERLAARGFSMEVLSFEKSADLDDESRRRALASRLDRAGVRWSPRRYHRRPSSPATLYDVAAGILAGLDWSRRNGGRVALRLVHSRSYVAGLIGLALKRVTGARLIFDTRSFLVDERIESGMWRADAAVARVARRVERELLEHSDATVVVTRAGEQALASLAPGRRLPRSRVIRPCADLERFRPAADPTEARAALGLPQAPIVVHAGALGTWYLGEETFAIGKSFAEQGGGRFVVLTRELDVARGLDSLTHAGALVRALHHEEMPCWLAAADAGLALVRPDPAKRGSTPVKLAEYLGCGLAVAATHHVGDLDEDLAGSSVAFTFDPGEHAAAVAERLLAAARLPARVREARALAVRHYSIERAVDDYAALYRDLGAASSPTSSSFMAREAS
jgi:glycosyltransferase involved in cell wall biosynthesis